MANKEGSSILDEFTGELFDNSASLSQLLLAISIQQKCASVGFDWPEVAPVFDKIKEELAEVEEALANPNKGQRDVEEELGDLLFSCLNLCRHLKVCPEKSLKLANLKFIKRFQSIEDAIADENERLEDQSLEALERLWIRAKKNR
jgi:ATP diphosphatase